jgi:hypothetical protein
VNISLYMYKHELLRSDFLLSDIPRWCALCSALLWMSTDNERCIEGHTAKGCPQFIDVF